MCVIIYSRDASFRVQRHTRALYCSGAAYSKTLNSQRSHSVKWSLNTGQENPKEMRLNDLLGDPVSKERGIICRRKPKLYQVVRDTKWRKCNHSYLYYIIRITF